MNKKNVVVTGASGHIGYHVASQLLNLGYPVLLIVRSENQNIINLKKRGASIHTANLNNPDSYQILFENADVLFHLAAENTTDTSNEESVLKNTFELAKTVIDTALSKNIKTIIYTSSVVVLGRSSNKNILISENHITKTLESPYVKGKFLAEQYCDKLIQEKQVDIRRLYPSWVVGNHDAKLTPPHKVIKDYLQKGQAFYFNGGISVAAVEEVAKAHINAWLKGKPNEKYVLGGSNISFKDFYVILSKHSGFKPPKLFIPKWFIYCGAVVAKILLGKKSPIDPGYVKTVIGNYSWYDSKKAIQELNYSIPTIDDVLKNAIQESRKKSLNLHLLNKNENTSVKKINYAENDVLLITGFPGWLGNRMVDVFMNGDSFGNNCINRKVRLLVQPKFKNLISLPANFEIVYGDILDKSTLSIALQGVKTVYHLAGIIYPKNIRTFYDVNVAGTKYLVDTCIEKGIRRILFMGTDSICGYGTKQKRIFDSNTLPTPYKNYGKSKYLAEKYILDKTKEGLIDGTSLRGFWFFGPFMPERNLNFFKMFHWKKQIVFGNGENYRSISHVDNTIQAFIKAEKEKNTFGKWYWIGDKKIDYTVNEIYQNIADGMGTKYTPLHIPNWVCELFGVMDNFLGLFGKLNATVHAAGKFHKDIAGEITAAQKDFNYTPDIGFEEIKKELKKLPL